jgi:hypothetical protein
VTSLLACLLVCIGASDEAKVWRGRTLYWVSTFDEISHTELIRRLNGLGMWHDHGDVAKLLAKTEKKDEKTLGNLSVNDLL